MKSFWKSDPRKRVLKKELKALSRDYEPKLDALRLEGKAPTDTHANLFGEYLARRGPFEEELLAIESRDLRRRALKCGVVVPPVHEWNRGTYGHYHLDEATRAGIKASICDQKRESIKFWVDVFAPVAALVVGILGALIGVLNACQNS